MQVFQAQDLFPENQLQSFDMISFTLAQTKF